MLQHFPQTNVAPDLCHHMAWLGHNELKSRFRTDYHKRWICLYIPDKYVLRKCVFQKEFLIYAKCRELIQRRCMKFIQTWQRFFPVFFCLFFFQMTFDLLLTNTSRLDTLKYTDQPIWLWFLLMISCQTDHKFDLNMFARIYRQQCILFIFVIFRFFFSEITRLCSFIIDTFCFVHNPSE